MKKWWMVLVLLLLAAGCFMAYYENFFIKYILVGFSAVGFVGYLAMRRHGSADRSSRLLLLALGISAAISAIAAFQFPYVADSGENAVCLLMGLLVIVMGVDQIIVKAAGRYAVEAQFTGMVPSGAEGVGDVPEFTYELEGKSFRDVPKDTVDVKALGLVPGNKSMIFVSRWNPCDYTLLPQKLELRDFEFLALGLGILVIMVLT